MLPPSRQANSRGSLVDAPNDPLATMLSSVLPPSPPQSAPDAAIYWQVPLASEESVEKVHMDTDIVPKRLLWHGRLSAQYAELLKDSCKGAQTRIKASSNVRQRFRGSWYWHNVLPLLCYGCDVPGFLRAMTARWQLLPESPLAPAMPHVFIWCSMIACNLILLGPKTDKPQPLGIQLGGTLLTFYQCVVAMSRFQLAGQPASVEEMVGYMTPALHVIGGLAVQSAASLGRIAPWTCVRARIGLMGITGLSCSASLWLWTAGGATAYPPGPTSFDISCAVWGFGLVLALLASPAARVTVHRSFSTPRYESQLK